MLNKEENRDFNAMLHKETDAPKIEIITDKNIIKKYGGNKMYVAPALDYEAVMKQIPKGKLITINEIREYFALENDADFTDPLTAGMFVNIVAWASEQRDKDHIPYWRTLKTHGEINPKYPGGIQQQMELLKEEGYIIVQKGRKNIRYYVKDYEDYLYDLK